MAHAWETAKGVPPEVLTLLEPHLGKIEPLIIVPEHKTALPGGTRESQSDVFMLARHEQGTVACTIEGKVDEPFGPTVGEQMARKPRGAGSDSTIFASGSVLAVAPAKSATNCYIGLRRL